MQLLSVATIYASTCLFFAISLPYFVNTYAWYIVDLQSFPILPLKTTHWGEDTQRTQSLMLTAALTINVGRKSHVCGPSLTS